LKSGCYGKADSHLQQGSEDVDVEVEEVCMIEGYCRKKNIQLIELITLQLSKLKVDSFVGGMNQQGRLFVSFLRVVACRSLLKKRICIEFRIRKFSISLRKPASDTENLLLQFSRSNNQAQ
jgi:hypothetical protein